MTITEWLLERMSELTQMEIHLVIPAPDVGIATVVAQIKVQAAGRDFTIFTDIGNLADTNQLENLVDILRYQIGSEA